MVNLLATVAVAVENRPIAALINALLFGKIPRNQKHMAYERSVFVAYIVDGRDRLSRYDENVGWRYRIDVTKRNHLIVFVNKIAWNLACNYFFEQRHVNLTVHNQDSKLTGSVRLLQRRQ